MSRSRPTVGEIVLIDPDGELDYLLAYVWDGAPLTVKRGVRGAALSTFETVARFTAKALIHDLDEKRIALRDLGWPLQGPLHSDYYTGAGGLEGDDSLKGVWKPWALGYNFNAEPRLLNSQYQIFQWSLTSSSAVSAFKHALRRRDWHAFAGRYNGPGQVDHYAGRIAQAYARHGGQ
ncbi:MAG: DUF3380 domain-containing protein [Rhodospirillales bacterium]|nr:DUF3380 domain-containing protein [Rhodospirillales bacterium]